jgi:hypothetical protein
MRKFTPLFFAAFLLFFIPTQSDAGTAIVPVSKTVEEAPESPEAIALQIRLDEIKAMDFSTMSSTERKQLRKEVRDIKSELREIGGGVYISVGAILIIILLLVILL